MTEPTDTQTSTPANQPCHLAYCDRPLCDLAPIGRVLLDTQGRIWQINVAGAKLLGQRPQTLLQAAFHEHLAAGDYQPFIDHLRRVFAAPAKTRHKLMLRPRHASIAAQAFQLMSTRPHRTGGSCCIGVMLDPLPQWRAEQQLAEQQAFQQRFLNTFPDVIVVIDAHGHIILVNDRWRQTARTNGASIALQEGLGIDYLAVCQQSAASGDADAMRAYQGIQLVLASQRDHFMMEYACIGPQRTRWFEFTVTALRQTAFSGAVIVHKDITNRKLAEEEIARRRRAMANAQKTEAMNTLVTSLVEQLAQPMTAAGLHLEMLSERLLPGNDVSTDLTEPLQQAAEQLHLLGQILAQTRDLFRRGQPEPELVVCAELCMSAIEHIKAQADARRIQIRTFIPNDTPRLWITPAQGEQVLLHLIQNAIDAISRSNTPRRLIDIVATPLPNEVRITVADTGPGLPPGYQGVALHSAITNRTAGTGIGLAVCRAIIEAHGGRFWLEHRDPDRDPGACIAFTLPYAPAYQANP